MSIPYRHLLGIACGLLAAAGASAQNLLLAYDFNQASPVYASSGSVQAVLRGTGPDQRAGDPGSGVSGLSGDRAWDASANEIQALNSETKAVNRSGLAHQKDLDEIDNLAAFTITFWFKADQQLSNAANRFVYNASQTTKPTEGFFVRAVSRASGGRRSFGLELQAGSGGAEAPPVRSLFFRQGTGYAKVDEWVFVAITWNGGRVDYYVGDRNSEVTPAGSGLLQGPLGNPNQPLIIANQRGFNRGFDGLIDNFRLYDGPLSPVALEALRAADVAGTPAP